MFNFLPTTLEEVHQKGWTTPLDIILITGDAYVDHPSFGAALIGRQLESQGFTVGIIAQPDWKTEKDFQVLGQPRLFFGITAGNMDSLVSNLTAEKRKRKKDDYSENGETGKRPDRAILVYTNRIKQLFQSTTVVIGGLEASLRRLTHFDYWSNKLRRSILLDSRADILVYGMADNAIVNIAQALKSGNPLAGIPNTARVVDSLPNIDSLEIPSHDDLLNDKQLFLKTTLIHEQEYAKKQPRTVIQAVQNKYVQVEPPQSLTTSELDNLALLPFTRQAHPKYQQPIPAFSFVKDSVVAHRGCYGGCSFCALTVHQGKYISSRSEKSILNEITNMISKQPHFPGVLLDVGGPSANMFSGFCKKPEGCTRLSCLVPTICPRLDTGLDRQLKLLAKIQKIPTIKKVFLNSGIRTDLALTSPKYIEALACNHTSGQLSVAPEHSSDKVLRLMQKPSFKSHLDFANAFNKSSRKASKEQYLTPYFIAAHPGCTLQEMATLAFWMKENRLRVRQVQTFIPLPMTLSAAMYYSQTDPWTKKAIHVALGEERRWQRALLQPWLPINKPLVHKALKQIGLDKKFKWLTS